MMRRLLILLTLLPVVVYAQVDIQEAVVPPSSITGTPTASLPEECDDGTLVYDSTAKVTKECTSNTWTAIASGGLESFTEAESTTAPNDTVYVDSLTAAAASTNADFAIIPKGTGAILVKVPDGTTAGGNKRGAGAVDWQGNGYLTRSVATQVASGAGSVIGGGARNTASQTNSTVGGGYQNSATAARATVGGGEWNTASSQHATVAGGMINIASVGDFTTVGGGFSNLASQTAATIAGGYDNTASAIYSTVGGGYQNQAVGNYTVVAGGLSNVATGLESTIGGGDTNTIASGCTNGTIAGGFSNEILSNASYTVIGGGQNNSIGVSNYNSTIAGGAVNTMGTNTSAYAAIGGGYQNTGNGQYSTIPGGSQADTRGTYGAFGYAAGRFGSTNGNAQMRMLVQRIQTTDGTADVVLTGDKGAASTSNVAVIASNYVYAVDVHVVARESTTTTTAGYWTCRALAINDGGTTTLVADSGCTSNVCACTAIYTPAGGVGWSAEIASVDSATDDVRVRVTGAAATNINWVAVMRLVEVG